MFLKISSIKVSLENSRKVSGKDWIKSVLLEYSCDEEYLKEFNEEKVFEILLITSCTPMKQT